MRPLLAILLLGACGVRLATTGDGAVDGASSDAALPDAPVAPVDARPCVGGDTRGVGPAGQCFVQFQTPAIYVDAKAACAAINAHLAYLKDGAADAFAEQLVGTFDTFIGGTDLAVEGSFVWDDGTPFSYTNWHTGEPNNGGTGGYQEDCVIIAGSRAGAQWDDRPCDPSEVPTSGMFAYLCEY